MHYLGRYTHRIAIGNSRILCMGEDTVTIKVKDYRNGGQSEGADPGWCRVRPPLSDACPSERLCQDTALWNLKQPEQAEADPHMQEPDRLP